MEGTSNGFCNKHSGIVSDIHHLQDENRDQWTKMSTIENKVDTIVSRLTYASISFAVMTIALVANIIIHYATVN